MSQIVFGILVSVFLPQLGVYSYYYAVEERYPRVIPMSDAVGIALEKHNAMPQPGARGL